MKRHITTIAAGCTALLLPLSVEAGPNVYEPMPQQTYEQSPLYQWFAGGSIGYLVDAEDEFYSLHFGRRLSSSGSWAHSLFLEVGYSDLENDGDEIDLDDLGIDPGDSFTGSADIEATFIPITLNYMVERQFTDRFGFYAGLGAGVALLDVDGEFSDDLLEIGDSGSDSETTFFAQAFTGLSFDVTEQFELFTGVRYMFIDDYEVSTSSGDLSVDDNDDFLVEVGGRVRF